MVMRYIVLVKRWREGGSPSDLQTMWVLRCPATTILSHYVIICALYTPLGY